MKNLLLVFVLGIIVAGCSFQNEQINPKEYSIVMVKVPPILVKEINQDDNRPERIQVISNSIKIHDIVNLGKDTYVFGIYKFNIIGSRGNKTINRNSSNSHKNNIFYGLFFRIIKKDNSTSGYKLLGGANTEGDYDPTSPFISGGSENVIWGIKQTDILENVRVTYSDQRTIDYSVKDKDHFVLYRTDNPDTKIIKVLYYDKNNRLIDQQ